MEFDNYLKNNARAVEIELSKILFRFLKDTKKTNPKLLPFAQKFIQACKGGKRIRGVLCKLGYEIAISKIKYQISNRNEVVKIGAAWEILHTAFLIHDDIIDQSPIRRGKQSFYEILGGNHYGISQAISIGDIGLYLPIKIITDSKFDGSIKTKVLSRFSQIVIDTGWGQVMDIVPKKDQEFVNLFKTAKYTIAGPLQIGAILGGWGPTSPRLRGVEEFGENLGMAFQIKDDILDGEGQDLNQALEYIAKAKKIIHKITDNEKLAKVLTDLADYVIERKQ